MILKGIIEEIIDNKTVLLRIPTLNGLRGSRNNTVTSDLYEASAVSIPGIDSTFNYGDIVAVGFLNNRVDYPIILGKFIGSEQAEGYYCPGTTIKSLNNPTLSLSELKVDNSAKLPADTIIGQHSYKDLLAKLESLEARLQKLEQQ